MALTSEERTALMGLAREAVAAAVCCRAAPPILVVGLLAQPGAAFVTLKRAGELRGCIGVVENEKRTLGEAVAHAARAAATDDTRFSPVTEAELEGLSIEISVLGRPVRVTCIDEIVVGRHGLLVRHQGHIGLLLPQVAVEWQWDRDTFLAQACRKAGLQPDAWRRGIPLFTFEAEVFGDRPSAIEAAP
jgi:uncharacterized protein